MRVAAPMTIPGSNQTSALAAIAAPSPHSRTMSGDRSPTITATTSVKQNTSRVMSGVSSSRVCSSPWSSASLGRAPC